MSSYTLGQYSPALIIPGLGYQAFKASSHALGAAKAIQTTQLPTLPYLFLPSKTSTHLPLVPRPPDNPWHSSRKLKEEGIMLFIYPNDNFICFLNLLNISSGPAFYKHISMALHGLGAPLLGDYEKQTVFSVAVLSLIWPQHFKSEECKKIWYCD